MLRTRAWAVLLMLLGGLALTGCAPDAAVVVTIRTQAFNGWSEEQPPPGEPIVVTLRPGESVTAPYVSSDGVVFTVERVDATVELSSSKELLPTGADRMTGSATRFGVGFDEELELMTLSEDYEMTYWITVERA